MPLIQVKTSTETIFEDDSLQKELSEKIAILTRKPESYVMTIIQTNIPMTFAGSKEPCCFIKLKSIGSLEPSSMTKTLCNLIASKTNIQKNRIYIEFIDVKATHWGYNNSTFG